MVCSGEESLRRFEVDGVPFISGNEDGLTKLGELLIRIAKSNYKSGFHLHIRENFDGHKEEILIIGIDHSNQQTD